MVAEWLGQHMMPCLYRQLFGFCCPFCGFQRSVIELLKGDWLSGFMLYPALPFLVVTAVICLSLKMMRKPVFVPPVKGLLMIDLAVIAVACVLKNVGVLPQ